VVGHQSLNLGRFNAAKSVERIVLLLKHQFDLQQVALFNRPSSDQKLTNFYVFGQAQRFEQVLINLVKSAGDALVEDQAARLDPATIHLSLSQASNKGTQGVSIKITDNGPSIALALSIIDLHKSFN